MKKLCVLLLVLALSLCLVPMTALAGDPCADGHTPDLEHLEYSWWTPCGGGYVGEYYKCTNCSSYSLTDGTEPTWENVSKSGHTPGKKVSADYVECIGGYLEDGFACKLCAERCDIEGNLLRYAVPSIDHVLEKEIHLTAEEIHYCTGWYTEDYQLCIYCGEGFVENENGTGYDNANKVTQWTDENGELVHIGGIIWKANYTPCFGGFLTDYYQCDGCGNYRNTNGGAVEFQYAQEGAKHIPLLNVTEIIPTPCGKMLADGATEVFLCADCKRPCYENGEPLIYSSSGESAEHDWGVHKAENEIENSCCGWNLEDYYACLLCGESCYMAADGTPVINKDIDNGWQDDPALRVHKLVHYSATDSCKEFWICVDCYSVYEDAEGKRAVDNHRNLIKTETDTTEPGDTTKPVDYAIALLISINPQFTIYADAQGNVLSVDFMNEDALSLQSEIRTSDCTVKECIVDIMAAAEKNGFFDEAPEMTVQVTESHVSKGELNILLEDIKNIDAGEANPVTVKIINADGSDYTSPAEPDDTTTGSDGTVTPPTGDMNIFLLIGIMAFAAIGLLTVLYCQKKRIF